MKRLIQFTLICLVTFSTQTICAEEMLRPFFLGSNTVANYDETILNVKKSLSNEGFDIVGEFSPYQNTTIIAVTNDALKNIAAKALEGNCKGGVLVAVQRISVTKVERKVQVSYTDPVYMGVAYQVDGSLLGQREKLSKALGRQKYYGSEEGLSHKDLAGYHYTFGMEYCKDYLGKDLIGGQPLNTYRNYKEALKTVNASLKQSLGGTFKVFQVDIPNNDVTIFGVGFKADDFSSDDKIMRIIDYKQIRHAAHLPYELFIIGTKSWALHPRFRIAINFPDLSMAGEHSFMKIMEAPDAIGKNLIMGAGGEYEEEDEEDDFF